MIRLPDSINTFVMPSMISKQYQKLMNRGVHERLEDLLETKHDPIETQRERQLSLLNDLLKHAVKHAPHYREKYADAPIPLDSLDQLKTLPPLEKVGLKEHADRLE